MQSHRYAASIPCYNVPCVNVNKLRAASSRAFWCRVAAGVCIAVVAGVLCTAALRLTHYCQRHAPVSSCSIERKAATDCLAARAVLVQSLATGNCTAASSALGQLNELTTRALPQTVEDWRIVPAGSCNISFVRNRPTAGQRWPRRRPRVAASLLTLERADLVTAALTTLVESGVSEDADFAVFAWANALDTPAEQYVRSFTGLPVVWVPNESGENQGIVIPRIRSMMAVLRHGCEFEYFMEMHDDMLFLQHGWLGKLLQRDRAEYGILMPFIANGGGSRNSGREHRVPSTMSTTEHNSLATRLVCAHSPLQS